MNLLEIDCSCLTLPHIKAFMELVGYPGNGMIAAALGATVWTYGYWRADHKAKQLAYAILLSQTVVGI